jgi:hypothetical protein
MSSRVTSMPFVAATWAIPLPMTPAPMTPIVLTEVDVHSYMPWAVASATTARLQLIAADKSRKIRLPIPVGQESATGLGGNHGSGSCPWFRDRLHLAADA